MFRKRFINILSTNVFVENIYSTFMNKTKKTEIFLEFF